MAERYRIPLRLGRDNSELSESEHGFKNRSVFRPCQRASHYRWYRRLNPRSGIFRLSRWPPCRNRFGVAKPLDKSLDRMDEIDRRFARDKPALATYNNLKDCELVTRIFHKTEIMPFCWNARRSTACRSIATAVRSPHSGIFTFRECTAPAKCRAQSSRSVPPLASPGGYVMDSQTRIMPFSTGAGLCACTRRLSARFLY